MKVEHITGQQATEKSAGVARGKETRVSREFGTYLQQELDARVEPTKASAVDAEGPERANSIIASGPQWNACSIRPSNTAAIPDALRGAGESLEKIAQSIHSGKSDLKSIDKIVNVLSSEAENLQNALGSLPDEHPLRQVGDELSVLAYVESVKWKRGDYL